MKIQPTEQWARESEEALLKKQLKYKDGKKNMMDIVLNDDETVEPSEEAQLVYHKPYSQMTEQEKAQLAADRLNFIFENTRGVGIQPDIRQTTLQDIYNTGYLDVWLHKGTQFSLENMPSAEELEKIRWEQNKDNNMRKMWKTFGNTAVEGFVKSAKASWHLFNKKSFEPEYDDTGTIWEILENGYSPMVNDPSKAGKKFTTEYWMNQFAQIGTSVGMASEMLLEGLLLRKAPGLRKLDKAADLLKAKMINNASRIEKYRFLKNEGKLLAGKGEYDKARKLLRTRLDDRAIAVERGFEVAHDYTEGALIAFKNATLNYQFNINEEYTRQINGGVIEEEAIRRAHKAAMETFEIEIWGSMALNVAQSRIINSITRARIDNAMSVIRAAANGERLASSPFAPISTKGIVGKNIGRFLISQLEEGVEEIWEDGMAMWGRQKAYLSEKELWDQMGMAYYMSDDTNTLIDSFIGGFMGGAFLSGARLGFSTLTGGGQTKMQKRQIEMYNTMAKNFSDNLNNASLSYIKLNRDLAAIDEDYRFGKDIVIKDADGKEKKVSSKDNNGNTNPEYKKAYEQKRKEIAAESNRMLGMFQTLTNAATAVKIVMSQIEGNTSGAVTENIKFIENRIAAINSLLKQSESSHDRLVDNIGEYNKEQALIRQIEELESKGEDATSQKNELEKLHTKWEVNGISDEMEEINNILTVVGDEMKDKNRNVILSDDETLREELDLANQRLIVTDVFNNAFYDYYAGINTDLNKAVKHATNEAYIYIAQMNANTNIDELAAAMKPVFDSIEVGHEGFFKSKRQQVAFMYAMFSKMNSNGQYDNLLQTLVSYMAQDSGFVAKRSGEGVLPTDFEESYDLDDYTSDSYKYGGGIDGINISEVETSFGEYKELIKNAKNLLDNIKYFERFEQLSYMRASISLFQDIFSDDKESRFYGLRDYITVEQYNELVDLMRKGEYRKMLDKAESLLKDMKDNKANTGEKFADSVNEVKRIENEIASLNDELDKLEKISDIDILNEVFDIKSLDDEITKLENEKRNLVDDDKMDTPEYDDTIKRIKELQDKKAAYEYVKKHFEEGDTNGEKTLESLVLANERITEERSKVVPEYNRRVQEEMEKAEKLEKLDFFISNGDYVDALVFVNSVLGTEQLSEDKINSLDISDDKKKEFIKKLNKIYKKYGRSKNEKEKNESIFDLRIELCREIFRPVNVTMSESERESMDKVSPYNENIRKEIESIANDIVSRKSSVDESIDNAEYQINQLSEEIKDKENSLDWKKSVKLSGVISGLRKEYASKDTNAMDNANENALFDLANFDSFFKKGDSEASLMLDEIRAIAIKSRKNIEYINNLGKENYALTTREGQLAYEIRERMFDIAQMPEDSVRKIRKKLKNYIKLYKSYMRMKKINESTNFKNIYVNAKSELEMAIVDTYNILQAQKQNEEVNQTTKDNNERRNKMEFVSNILENNLSTESMKQLAYIDKADFNAVIEKLREIQKNTDSNEKDKIDEIILKIRAERDKYNQDNLNGLIEEKDDENEEKESETNEVVIKTHEDLEEGIVYYFDESMESLVMGTFDKSTRFQLIDRKQLPGETADVIIRKDDKIHRYENKNNSIKEIENSTIVLDNTSEGNDTGNASNDVIQVENSLGHISLSHISPVPGIQDEEGNEMSMTKRYVLVFEAVRDLMSRNLNIVDFPYAVPNVDDNTEGLTLIDYVNNLLQFDNETQAVTFVSYVIPQIVSAKNINELVSRVCLRCNPQNTDIYNDEFRQMFYSISQVYATHVLKMNPNDYINMVEAKLAIINEARYITGGINPSIDITTARAKTSELERDGIKVNENDSKYSGNHFLSVHQNFDEIDTVKTSDGKTVSRRLPRFIDKDSNSIITKEGINELQHIAEETKAHIVVDTDAKEIYEYNINMREAVYENGKFTGEKNTLFLDELEKAGITAKKWEDFTDDEKKKVKEIMADCAVIKIKSGDKCIGFLPQKGHYSLKNTKIEGTVKDGYQTLFTPDGVANTEKKIENLNRELADYRDNIFFWSVESEFSIGDNDITASAERGTIEPDPYLVNDETTFGNESTAKKHNKSFDITFIDQIPYVIDSYGRKNPVVLPGATAVDENTNAITYISSKNYDQDGFRLSNTMPNVFHDTKAKLCLLLLQYMADCAKMSSTANNVVKQIIVSKKALFASIIGKDAAKTLDIDIANYGSENFYKTKDLLSKYFTLKGSDLCLASNMNSDKWTYGDYNHENLFKYVVGGLEKEVDKPYYKSDFGNGFNFFLGDYSEFSSKNGILSIRFNESDKIQTNIMSIIQMMFGKNGNVSMDNFNEKVDTFTISYPSIGKMKNVSVYGEPKEGAMINFKQVADVNTIDINDSNRCSLIGELSSQDGSVCKVEKAGNSFYFVTNPDNINEETGEMTGETMNLAQVNIGFGNVIKNTISATSQTTNDTGVIEHPATGLLDDMAEEQNNKSFTPTGNIVPDEEISEEEFNEITDGLEETGEKMGHVFMKKEWGFEDIEMYELAKVFFRRFVELIGKKDIGFITMGEIAAQKNKYIRNILKAKKENEPYFMFSIFLKFNKDLYNSAEKFASAVVDKYNFLDYGTVLKFSKDYLSGELSYKSKMSDESIGNYLFWERFLKTEVQEAMFGKDGYFNTLLANIFNSTKKLMDVDENIDEDEEDELGRLSESGKFEFSEDNTTPLVSTLSEKVKIFMATIKRLKPKRDKDRRLVIVNGKIQYENYFKSEHTKNLGQPEVYDQHEVVNFLREIGTRNKEHNWQSVIDEIRKIAEDNGDYSDLAYSLLESFNSLEDNNVRTEIIYKMMSKAKCRYRYLAINEIERDYGEEGKELQTIYVSRMNSRTEDPGALFYELTDNVFGLYNLHGGLEILAPYRYADGTTNINVIAENGEKIAFTDEFKTYVYYFTNKNRNGWDSKKFGEYSVSKNIFAMLAPFKKDNKLDRQAIDNDTEGFYAAIEQTQIFLDQIYGHKFNMQAIVEAGYDTISGILDTINTAVLRHKDVYDVDVVGKKKITRNIPYLMKYRINSALRKLCDIEMKHNTIPDEIIVKSGGKNNQSTTDRSFCDWQVIDLQNENSEVHKFVMSQNTWNSNTGTRSWHPQLCGDGKNGNHIFDDAFNHGLNDISVCRYKGDFSGKMTELNDNDQIFVKTLLYFNTTNFNWDTDIFKVFLGKDIQLNARYTVVQDFTDSNKSKSAYWRLMSVIPEINSNITGNISSEPVNAIKDAEMLFKYVHEALFVSEINRIKKIVGKTAKNSEFMVFSNLTYNKLRFNAVDNNGETREFSLLEYLNGIDEKNRERRLHFLDTLANSKEAQKMTIDIINEKMIGLTGVSMVINNNMIMFRLDDEAVKKSVWRKSRIIETNGEGKVLYNTANFNDDNKSYSKNINKIRDTQKINNAPKIFYIQAAVDYCFNELVNNHFILNVLHGGAYNFIESDIYNESKSDKYSLAGIDSAEQFDAYTHRISNLLKDRVYKRMAGAMTGGNKAYYSQCYVDENGNDISDPNNRYYQWGGVNHDKFLYLNVASVNTFSDNIEYYVKLYGRNEYEDFKRKGYFDQNSPNYFMNNPSTRTEISKRIPKISLYLDIDWTDGQEFCSWREAVDTMYAKGAISYDEFKKLRNVFEYWNGKIDKNIEEDVDRIINKGMQVFKPVYYGTKVDKDKDGNGIRTSVDYVKSSVCPLFPHFTNGTAYDPLLKVIDALEKEKKMNVHLCFDSCVKVGGKVNSKLTIDDLNSMVEKGEIGKGNKSENAEKALEKLDNSSFIADRKYYSIQNETDNKLQNKIDERNRKIEDLAENSKKMRLHDNTKEPKDNKYYTIHYCLDYIEDELGVDFENDWYNANSLVDTCATILAPKFMSDETKNLPHDSDKYKKAFEIGKKQAKTHISEIVFQDIENKKINPDYFDELNAYMFNKGVTGFKEENLRNLLGNVYRNMLNKAAYLQAKAENADNISERVKEITEKKTSYSEQLEYINEIYRKDGKINRNESIKPFDDVLEGIISEGSMRQALDRDAVLEQMYFDTAENVELKTVELTQLEHMLTSNGISKIKDKIFTIPADVVSEDMREMAGIHWESFLEQNKEDIEAKYDRGGKIVSYKVNGKMLENIRNWYEITESFNNMMNLLYDKKEGFGILTKDQYNKIMEDHDVSGLRAVLNRKEVQLALKRRILDEMKQRTTGTNVVDLIDNDVPLILNPALPYIENVLMALVKRNISRTYLTGSSFFLMSSAGMKLKKSGENITGIKDIIWLDRKRGTGELKATTDKSGNITMAECAIAPQFTYFDKKNNEYKVFDFKAVENGKYRYLVDENGNDIKEGQLDGKTIFMREGSIDPEILKIISLRVPTSGLMNSCAMKIVAFLPNSYSGTIIVPKEHIAQFGEDFDIDKRFCYLMNWIVKEGKIKKLTGNDISNFDKMFSSGKYRKDTRRKAVRKSLEDKLRANRLIDIYMSVLTNPDRRIQEKINATLEWEKLKETKKYIIISNPEEQSVDGVIRSTGDIRTQTELSVKSSSGQKGTGAWSNKIVFSAILSKIDEGVHMQECTDGQTYNNVVITICDNKIKFNGNLSNEITLSDDKKFVRTKMEVDAAQQNVNLDTVKEDIIAWINQNTETLPFFMMMSQMGFDLTDEIIAYKPVKLNDGTITFDKEIKITDKPVRINLASLIAVQPIIRRLSELELDRKSFRKEYKSNVDIIKQLLTEFGFTKEEVDAMADNNGYSNSSLNDEIQNYRITANGMLEKQSKNGIHDYHGLNGQKLYQNIYRPTGQIASSETLKLQQLRSLSLFLYIRSKGYELQKYRNLVTINSRGIGKTYMSVNDKINALNDIAKNMSFKNLSKMIGEFRLKKNNPVKPDGYYDIEGCDYWIMPTTAEGNNLIMSILAAETIVGNSTGYSSENMKKMFSKFDKIFRDRNIYQEEREKMRRRIIHDMQIYFLMSCDEICKNNGREGIFKNYGNIQEGRSIEFERLRLISSNYKKLSAELKKHYKDEHDIDDTFIQCFYTVMKNKPKFISDNFFSHFSIRSNGTIDFFVKANQEFDKRAFQNALLEMWDNEKGFIKFRDKTYSCREFVKDIIALAYVMDDRQGINNFKDLIPERILEETGMIDAMKTVGEIIENSSEETFDRCFEQIVVNNAEQLLINVKDKIHVRSVTTKEFSIHTSRLKESGLLNPDYNENDEYGTEPMYVSAFMQYVSKTKIRVFFFDHFDNKTDTVHYKVKIIERREGSNKNSYNPFLDFFDSESLSSTSKQPESKLDQNLRITPKNTDKTNKNAIEVLDKITKDKKGKRDPMVELLEAVMKKKMFDGFYVSTGFINDRKSDSDGETARVSFPLGFEIRYRKDLVGKDLDYRRMVMDEEIMHVLLWGYLDGMFDKNGELIKGKGYDKRFEKSLEIFNKLNTYFYNNIRYFEFKLDAGDFAHLKNIFKPENNLKKFSFNEFLSNIMSCNKALIQLIKEYETTDEYKKEEGNYGQTSNDENWFSGIIHYIVDFIVDTFKKICDISKIHKDVANEVMRTITNIYLTNDEGNIADDKIDMIDRVIYSNKLEEIKGSEARRENIMNSILEAKTDEKGNKLYNSENCISVSKVVEKIYPFNSDAVGQFVEVLENGEDVVYTEVGNMFDDMAREAMSSKLYGKALFEYLKSNNKRGKYVMSDESIQSIVNMKGRLLASGKRLETSVSEKIRLGITSDFTINGKHVTAEPDTVIVDNNNNVTIIDFKSFYHKENKESIFYDRLKPLKYSLQLALYKLIASERTKTSTGINVKPMIMEFRYSAVPGDNGTVVVNLDRIELVNVQDIIDKTLSFSRNVDDENDFILKRTDFSEDEYENMVKKGEFYKPNIVFSQRKFSQKIEEKGC